MTTRSGVTSDDKIGIMTTPGFQWYRPYHWKPRIVIKAIGFVHTTENIELS